MEQGIDRCTVRVDAEITLFARPTDFTSRGKARIKQSLCPQAIAICGIDLEPFGLSHDRLFPAQPKPREILKMASTN